MPLPFAVPFGLLVGISLAWLARVELARSEAPLVMARPFLVALALAALVHAPVFTYFVALHGDWAYLYLVRFGRVPSAVDLLLVLAAAAQVPLGFALASRWAIAKRGGAVLRVSAVLGGILLVLCVIASKRLAVSASFAQFHGGFGVAPLAKTPLGRGVLLSWLTLLAGYGWCARVLRAPRTE